VAQGAVNTPLEGPDERLRAAVGRSWIVTVGTPAVLHHGSQRVIDDLVTVLPWVDRRDDGERVSQRRRGIEAQILAVARPVLSRGPAMD